MELEDYSTLSLIRELAKRKDVFSLETKESYGSMISIKVKLDKYYGLIDEILKNDGGNDYE